MLHRHATPAVAGAFTLGALAGALTSAMALILLAGLLSPIPVAARAGLALCALVMLALHQSKVLCLGLPQRAWQIPQEVFQRRPTRAAFRFAYELGTGVRTYITTAAPYGLAVVLALVPGTAPISALVGAFLAAVGYGFGRSIVVASQVMGRSVAVDHPRRWLHVAAWLSLASAASVAVHVVAAI